MNYVKSLGKQLASKGIRVNGVAPGPIWTPLQISGGATMEKVEKFGGQTSLGRPGQPAELASIYVQLAAADATYATGQVYGSSGGTGSREADRARASRGRAATSATGIVIQAIAATDPSGAVDRGGKPMPADGFHGKVK